LLVACSSHASDPKKPTGSNTPVPGDAPPSVATPSEQECDALFAHAIELHLAEVKQTKPAQLPTDDELAKLRTELRAQELAACRATTVERYRCAMAATTLAVLSTCQATPSSSTSNSNVAPGGMTPAAPRSP
jgi:hypothetical protein